MKITACASMPIIIEPGREGVEALKSISGLSVKSKTGKLFTIIIGNNMIALYSTHGMHPAENSLKL
jgi:hypothetical protein